MLECFGALWKRPWCWKRLRAGGEGGNRGWEGGMASSTWQTWVWANSRRYWRIAKPGVLQSKGSQRVRHHFVTEQQQGDLELSVDGHGKGTVWYGLCRINRILRDTLCREIANHLDTTQMRECSEPVKWVNVKTLWELWLEHFAFSHVCILVLLIEGWTC